MFMPVAKAAWARLKSDDKVLSSLAKRSLRGLFARRCCGPFTTKKDLSVMINRYLCHDVMPNARSQILLAHHHIFGELDESNRRKR